MTNDLFADVDLDALVAELRAESDGWQHHDSPEATPNASPHTQSRERRSTGTRAGIDRADWTERGPKRARVGPVPYEVGRQPDEPPRAFSLFVHYRDAGAQRSLSQTAAAAHVSQRYVERLSARWHWVARCEAFDSWVDELRVKAIAQVRAAAARLQERARIAEQDAAAEARAAARAPVEAARLERERAAARDRMRRRRQRPSVAPTVECSLCGGEGALASYVGVSDGAPCPHCRTGKASG